MLQRWTDTAHLDHAFTFLVDFTQGNVSLACFSLWIFNSNDFLNLRFPFAFQRRWCEKPPLRWILLCLRPRSILITIIFVILLLNSIQTISYFIQHDCVPVQVIVIWARLKITIVVLLNYKILLKLLLLLQLILLLLRQIIIWFIETNRPWWQKFLLQLLDNFTTVQSFGALLELTSFFKETFCLFLNLICFYNWLVSVKVASC